MQFEGTNIAAGAPGKPFLRPQKSLSVISTPGILRRGVKFRVCAEKSAGVPYNALDQLGHKTRPRYESCTSERLLRPPEKTLLRQRIRVK